VSSDTYLNLNPSKLAKENGCTEVTLEDTYRNGFADFVMLPTTNFENSGDTIDYADIV
jgi:hypothetical protein